MHEVYYLHGFLGLPQDWNRLIAGRDKHIPYPLFSEPLTPLSHWGARFNQQVIRKPIADKRTLVGYSLGGRLSLHALTDNPHMWSSAVLISADPGIEDEQERSARLQSDLRWSQRFLEDPWAPLLADWNQQAVFKGSFHPNRLESEFNRKSLAHSLDVWSLGRQRNLENDLKLLDIPILWIYGARDSKAASSANRLTLKHPLSKVVEISEAGHRVLWDQPVALRSAVESFIHTVS